MAAITATAVAVGQPATPEGPPPIACVTSSGAVAAFNVHTSLWMVLSMVTT